MSQLQNELWGDIDHVLELVKSGRNKEAVQLLQGEAGVSSYGGWVAVSAGSWNGKAVHRLIQSACDTPAAWNHTPLPLTPGGGPP